MVSSQRRQIEDWIRMAERAGWTITARGRGAHHYKWYRPDGAFAFSTPATPGGGNRSMENIRAKLRRNGLPV